MRDGNVLMRRLAFLILCFLAFPIQSASPWVHGTSVIFTGLLDTYPGATWYVSCAYKPTNAYSGNCATVRRQSTNTTTTIGFLPNGKADVTSFNTFCSGTNCFLDSWVDAVNGINTTDASSAGFQPRMIVNANGNIAVCPQPGSKATTAFNAAVNTQKQHLFAVAKGSYADNRHAQADVPTIAVTGTVTNGSPTITVMSSQVGISIANDSVRGPKPGVSDSANFIPGPAAGSATGNVYYSALPSGTTATMSPEPGNLSFPTGTQAGDNLTFTNSVLSGIWILNGPAAGTLSNSYWGVGLGPQVPSDWYTGINAATGRLQNAFGNGMRAPWAVYDYETFTSTLNYNGTRLGTSSSTGANITYSTNVGMTLFSNTGGTEGSSNACFETIVLYSATQASRIPMAQFLMAQNNIVFPFAANTSDGFTMTGLYQPNAGPATTIYGSPTVGPDVYGGSWNNTQGGYTWPSTAYATNINNSTTMWRFIVQQGDSDTNITAQERAEIAWAGAVATKNGDFSFFYQFQYEAIPTQNGSWCDTGQLHYGNSQLGVAPDLVTLHCTGGVIQIQTQKDSAFPGGSVVTTNCGAAQTLTAGVTYAVVGTGHWSNTGSSDTLTVNFGTNGTTLSAVCSTSGSLWNQETVGAYLKAGTYRGNLWENAGTVIQRVYNLQFNPTTANAYSAYITAQPAIPTHP